MKSVVILALSFALPETAHAGLFAQFSDVCLAPVLSEGAADVASLNEIDPTDYGLRAGNSSDVTLYATSEEDFYFRVFDSETLQCTAHHFDYANADLKLNAFTAVAQRFGLTRRGDCDQIARGGEQIVYYQAQQGIAVTSVWLNTDDKARVTWMGLRHAKDGMDCS